MHARRWIRLVVALVARVGSTSTFVSPAHVDATAGPPASRAGGRPMRATDTEESAPSGTIVGVAASSIDRATVVVWDHTSIRRSRDDGRTFLPILQGNRNVISVAVDDRGEVLAVRGDLAAASRPNELASTRALRTAPPIDPREVYAAGRFVLVVGLARGAGTDANRVFARTGDGGRTWQTLGPGSWGNFGNLVRLEPDGTVRHLWATEAGCGGGMQSAHRWGPRDTDWVDDQWPFDAPVSMQIGGAGWYYAIDDQCAVAHPDGAERVCGTRGGRTVALSAPVEDSAWQRWSLATNGPITLATIEGRLVSLTGSAMHTIEARVPPGFQLAQVDARGRGLGVLRRRVVRWSRRAGWRVIAE